MGDVVPDNESKAASKEYLSTGKKLVCYAVEALSKEAMNIRNKFVAVHNKIFPT